MKNSMNPFFGSQQQQEYSEDLQFKAPRLNRADLEDLLEFSFSEEYQKQLENQKNDKEYVDGQKNEEGEKEKNLSREEYLEGQEGFIMRQI